ncbi:response regulator transcription factor [Alsobacter sp. SYSU M60028]|uniref:Response regulator transcription factor n=1 Tax=Alsobacter ponti TaxID=2962936 RepID=A0ABT1LB69_9HYPH|nr:response regulator transcription factor [Alsobacter ponti]MCP8938308.1 response regulator transcription factor [Alsobacter ponti]
MKILVIEDDAQMADYVAGGLRDLGHSVTVAADGHRGRALALGEPHDLVVLDRMLPGVDGLDILRAMRAAGVKAPVIFLTTKGGIQDRVEGLDAGADDYLVKPFAFSELAARVHALGRRPPLPQVETRLTVADLDVDLISREVKRAGKPIELQPREFKLLTYLMRNAGQVVTRTMLLEHVWDFHFDPKTSIVETHLSRLRGKIDRDFPVELIVTVRGAGYMIRDRA